jgi:hypothetical protein
MHLPTSSWKQLLEVFFGSATPCASPPPGALLFLIILFLCTTLLNREDRHLLASPNGLLLLISMVVFSKKKNVYVSLRIKLRTRIRLGVSLPSFDTIAQNGVLCVSWKAIDPWRNLAWARFAPGCPKWDSMYSMYPLLHKLMLRRSYLHKYVFGSIELCKNMFWWWMCNFVKHLFALA